MAFWQGTWKKRKRNELRWNQTWFEVKGIKERTTRDSFRRKKVGTGDSPEIGPVSVLHLGYQENRTHEGIERQLRWLRLVLLFFWIKIAWKRDKYGDVFVMIFFRNVRLTNYIFFLHNLFHKKTWTLKYLFKRYNHYHLCY